MKIQTCSKSVDHQGTGSLQRDLPGFVLIVTLTLMVLLLILAMGMLSLSTVHLRTSGHASAQQIAQSNARIALMLALGELQKSVGPDQRITAPAGINPANSAQPRLLGVWKSNKPANTDTTAFEYDYGNRVDANSEPAFLQWLASGDTATVTDMGYPESSPSAPILLVKEGSVPATTTGQDLNEIQAASIPVGDTGKYAWYVFDESQKANLTLANPTTTTEAEQVAALGASGMPGFTTLADENTTYSPLANLSTSDTVKVASLGSTALLGNSATFNPVAANAFHILSTSSKSLLVDVANGGYQKDLSLLFADDTLPASYTARHIYSENNTPIAPAPSRFTGAEPIPSPDPKWSLLHSHYNLYKNANTTGSTFSLDASEVERSLSTEYFEKQQILPVVANAQFIFSMAPQRHNLNPPYVGFLGFWVDVVITLWNPYNVALECDSMEFEFYRFPLQVEFFREDGEGVKSASSGNPVHIAYMFNPGNNPSGTDNIQDTLPYRGRIPNSFRMEPGEFKVFGKPSQTYNHKNWNYTVGLELDEGFDRGKGGIFERYISTNATYNAQCPWPGPGRRQQIQVKLGDTYTVEVGPAKVDRSTSFDETNGEEIVSYLKIFQGDGGRNTNVSDVEGYKDELDQNRTQVGAIEIDLSDSVMSQKLPSYGRNDMSQLTVTDSNLKPQGDASEKVPFLIASLRLKTELDSDSESASMWLHNGITNQYFTSGMSGDQDEDAKSHQYELTWEPMTSWTNIPTVEVDDQDRGYGGTGVTAGSGVNFAPFLQVPLAPATSIAQFSHAPLNTGGQAPLTTQIIGNSLNSPLIPLSSKSKGGSLGTHVDHSYMANNTLFDGYFLSTAAAEDGPLTSGSERDLDTVIREFFEGTKKLRNPSLQPTANTAPTITTADYDTFAQHLFNHGAFNVNSTSVEAWALFLASGTKESLPILDMLTASTSLNTTIHSTSVPVSRFAPLIGQETDATISDQNRWYGHRRLNSSQIMTLAEKVVEEVKARGPFQSVAEFVNRQIVSDPTKANSGALQTAIENASLNTDLGQPAPKNASELSSGTGSGNTSDGAATQIIQSDLLNRLAPSLTVRGDTFRIRAYGETTINGKTTKAWCEAIVQRGHNFVDQTQAPTTATSSLNATNSTYGRRLKIVSFRWLSPSEV